MSYVEEVNIVSESDDLNEVRYGVATLMRTFAYLDGRATLSFGEWSEHMAKIFNTSRPDVYRLRDGKHGLTTSAPNMVSSVEGARATARAITAGQQKGNSGTISCLRLQPSRQRALCMLARLHGMVRPRPLRGLVCPENKGSGPVRELAQPQ